MTFYRRNLPHLPRDAKPHFVTFCTKNRWTLPGWARDIVLDCVRHDEVTRYDLLAVVVMPDHVHLIVVPQMDEQRRAVIKLHDIMKAIKGASAHKINQQLNRHGTVWQEESFDRVLRSSEDLDAKILYVLENPVRRGLVSDWQEYRWVWRRSLPNPYKPPRTTEGRTPSSAQSSDSSTISEIAEPAPGRGRPGLHGFICFSAILCTPHFSKFPFPSRLSSTRLFHRLSRRT
jgi:REP element-mobilizing transposase RayT